MKSRPAASAMRARRRQSGQLADQRSGTLVAERPDEQFAPKTPILSALALYMAMRSCIDAVRANMAFSIITDGGTNAPSPSASFRGATKWRAWNPVTPVSDYWIPGSFAALGPRNDGTNAGMARACRVLPPRTSRRSHRRDE